MYDVLLPVKIETFFIDLRKKEILVNGENIFRKCDGISFDCDLAPDKSLAILFDCNLSQNKSICKIKIQADTIMHFSIYYAGKKEKEGQYRIQSGM